MQLCSDLFGDIFNPAYIAKMVQGTNEYYGDKNLEVQNVVFSQGSCDPWHTMGRITDLNEKSPAIFIQGKLPISTENNSILKML